MYQTEEIETVCKERGWRFLHAKVPFTGHIGFVQTTTHPTRVVGRFRFGWLGVNGVWKPVDPGAHNLAKAIIARRLEEHP